MTKTIIHFIDGHNAVDALMCLKELIWKKEVIGS